MGFDFAPPGVIVPFATVGLGLSGSQFLRDNTVKLRATLRVLEPSKGGSLTQIDFARDLLFDHRRLVRIFKQRAQITQHAGLNQLAADHVATEQELIKYFSAVVEGFVIATGESIDLRIRSNLLRIKGIEDSIAAAVLNNAQQALRTVNEGVKATVTGVTTVFKNVTGAAGSVAKTAGIGLVIAVLGVAVIAGFFLTRGRGALTRG